MKITHLSLFDETIQGIETSDKRCFSFQGHPEASPGPQEIQELFDAQYEIFPLAREKIYKLSLKNNSSSFKTLIADGRTTRT